MAARAVSARPRFVRTPAVRIHRTRSPSQQWLVAILRDAPRRRRLSGSDPRNILILFTLPACIG
jgi:hypothetical protein